MGSFARPLLTLLAVLPLAAGPAAWAWECGCEAACDAATEATASACECCADCPSGCCGTPGERGEPASDACSAEPGAGCECGCVVEAPVPPAVPAGQSQFAPPRAAPAPFEPAADDPRSCLGLEEPDPAAGPPVRVRLCVWRN